jgi:hypothetical protein
MSAMLSCLKRLLWRLVDPKAAFPQSAQFQPIALLAKLAPRNFRGTRHSYFRSFSQGESVVDVHSQVADRVLYFAVPQQYLHSTQVASRFVNQRSLRPTQ